MTTPEEMDAQEPEATPQEISHYVIDPSLAREHGLSLSVILLARRCPSCKARLEAGGEMPSEEQHIKEIVECCAAKEGFIKPEMPLQEIVFRTLLSEKKQLVSLEQLHYLVTEGWFSPINPRSLTVTSLKRVLDSDNYYGFKEVLLTPTEK